MAAQVVMPQPFQATHDPAASIQVSKFKWHSADKKLQGTPAAAAVAAATPPPPLGVLSAFNGNFSGTGISLIFRPNNSGPKATTFKKPISPPAPAPPSENVLEINLTTETLNFGAALGSVPNRGLGSQADAFLNGVPYVQTVNDVANCDTGKADGAPIGIHFEPGVWMHLPATTTDPVLGASLVRMGSIPHGTTINAQCLEPTQTFSHGPQIPAVDITPFIIGSNPPNKITFAAQTAKDDATPRIPQDLSKFIAAGTITQAILDDPNTVLRNANIGKNIINTEVFTVSTTPSAPELGGGTASVAFLVGAATAGPNAFPVSMSATFWINTVQTEIHVPTIRPGQAPLHITAAEPHPGARVPTFAIPSLPASVDSKTITVTHTEIQYSQTVNLNFAGLTWPHVSVATLVPTTVVPVPPHVVIPPHGDHGPAIPSAAPQTVHVQAPIQERIVIEPQQTNGSH